MKVALENTPKLMPYTVKSMGDVLAEMLGSDLDPELRAVFETHPVYVVSNRSKVHGATAMLFPKMLAEVGECIGSDFYIVPSSIHELIFIPARYYQEQVELAKLIVNVNENELKPQDVLSDHPYYFSRENEEVRM